MREGRVCMGEGGGEGGECVWGREEVREGRVYRGARRGPAEIDRKRE